MVFQGVYLVSSAGGDGENPGELGVVVETTVDSHPGGEA